jgi:cytoskeleton protein RodZ
MSLGSMITKARKDAGLSIDDLSAATNIRALLIRQMESDNFSQCGGETYARGHLRNIAVKLNVDPKLFTTAFEDEQMHVDRSMQDLLVENSVMREPNKSRKISWKVLVVISISVLFIVGIAQIAMSNNSSPDIPIAAEEIAQPTTEPTAEPVDEPIISTGDGVKVIITATRAKSWLFISDSSGQTLFSGQISQGVSKSFSASEQLNLKVGNAGGVDLTVNGKKIDPIGIDGEVVSVSYGVDS